MARMEQGQDLQETPIVDANGNIVTNEDGGGKKPNLPKLGPKQIALGVAGLVVVVILIFVFSKGKGSGKPTEQDSSEMSTTVSTGSDELPGFLPPTSTSSVSYSGFIDNSNDYEPVEEVANRTALDSPYTYFSYSAQDVRILRGCGYTGDEIEFFAQNKRSVESLVDEANKELNEHYKTWRESVLDDASEGYKALMDKTYLGNKETRSDVTAADIKIGYNLTENVDYEKIGVFNYQAWIKVKLSYGDVFMNVPIERYTQLTDKGNIVVSFNARCGEGDVLLEITNLKEVRV